MSNPPANLILSHLHRLSARAGAEASDRELLRRFVAYHDEEAFARLLRRHRPMVQGVSLRVLGNWHDSEDVVQATFLVLARKAGTLRWQESAASWLYRVAYHLSLKVRAAAGRRQRLQQQTPARAMPDAFEDIRLSEAQALLDAELATLPDKYRTPLLLCCLQAVTRDEAARQLGWSLATLKRRLARGRELLQARLARRGLTLSAVLGASLLRPDGVAVEASATSARAAALAEGMLRAMAIAKWKTITLALLIFGALATGGGLLVRSGWSESPPEPEQPASIARTETKPSAGTDQYGDDLPPCALARFGTVRFRQGSFIYGIALSPDDRLLVTVGGNNVLHLWDVTTGREVHRFPKERETASTDAAAFSPDGRTFATGGFFGVSLWRADTGERLHFVETGQATSLAFAPNGKTLAVGYSATGPSLWDVASGRQIVQLQERGAQPNAGHIRAGWRSLAFSPDGQLLASTCDNNVLLWDVAARQETRRLEGHWGRVHAVAFSPDGKVLASGGEDRMIWLWESATGRKLRQLNGHAEVVTSVMFTPDGKALVSGSGDQRGARVKERQVLRLWDVASGEARGTIGEHGSGASPLTLARDGSRVISADGGTIRFWDLATRREVRPGGGHRNWIGGMAFSPDGKQVATGGGDRTVRLWDSSTGRELRTLAVCEAEVDSVAFSPDGRLLAGASRDGVIRLWNASSGKEIRQIRGHAAYIHALAFAPDGRTLLSGSMDSTALLWDVRGRKGRSQPNPAGREKQWQALADADAARAFQAINDLTHDPHAAVSLLAERVHAVRVPDPQRLAHCLTDLDSDRFEVREQAAKEIEDIGELAKPALQKALAGKPSLEVRRRIEQLLGNTEPAHSAEQRRTLRAIEVLEHIGTPEARRVLERLALGAENATLTREARASVKRLGRQP